MIKQIAQGIYMVENFLTEDEIKGLLSSAELNAFIEVHQGNIVQDLSLESLSYVPLISDRLMSYFKDADSHTKITNIRRLKNKEYMNVHSDGGYPNSEKKIVFGIAIYLNDDFDGGFLNYPDLKVSVKPKRGSMVIHNAKLIHEVLPVLSGNRYSITTFIFGDDDTRIKI